MARKGSSTIVQEELYPSGNELRADHSGNELDDARLVDLDAAEESPFLRGQKRISARRGSLPKKTAYRLLWATVALAALCIIAIVAAGLYEYGERSWRFRVESSDNIEILGTQNVTKPQIMEVMGADIGRNIFFIPLEQQKAQLEQIPWVESASVMRFVPNRLQVVIHERTPVAFGRIGPRIALIDAGGTLMDLSQKHKYSFPVILGMNPGEPLSTRAPRMKAYDELVAELDSAGAHYSQDLSEVDLSDLEDVKVRVNDSAGDVLVHLGSSEYLRRYKIYVSHVQQWRQQFQKLESVDLRYDNQIIVNPDLQGTAKEAALTPAAAKLAQAAGVKPAALITRSGPHDRAIPKPAFELPESRLNPKAATSGAKRPLAKTKLKKAAATVKNTLPLNRTIAPKTMPPKPGSGPSAAATGAQKPASGNALPPAASPAQSSPAKPSPAIAKQQGSQSAD